MNIVEVKNALIPAITTFIGAPLIMGDDIGSKPKEAHATYKITTPYAKAVGQAEETPVQNESGLQIKRVESYLATFSFSSYAMDEDVSFLLAQKIHDWFSFEGYEVLDGLGIVVSDKTPVVNRDAFFIEDYERRNGFDVILKVTTERLKSVDWFDSVDIKSNAN